MAAMGPRGSIPQGLSAVEWIRITSPRSPQPASRELRQAAQPWSQCPALLLLLTRRRLGGVVPNHVLCPALLSWPVVVASARPSQCSIGRSSGARWLATCLVMRMVGLRLCLVVAGEVPWPASGWLRLTVGEPDEGWSTVIIPGRGLTGDGRAKQVGWPVVALLSLASRCFAWPCVYVRMHSGPTRPSVPYIMVDVDPTVSDIYFACISAVILAQGIIF
ncbi:hypothetical protein Dimus_029859 [Dionaea muscipula]